MCCDARSQNEKSILAIRFHSVKNANTILAFLCLLRCGMKDFPRSKDPTLHTQIFARAISEVPITLN